MKKRNFGNTGLRVTEMGFGAGHIGHPDLNEVVVEKLLNTLLDLGINLIDTARSYGLSEARIGKHISHRRNEFIISTKVGYGYQDYPDWSYAATMGTIEESLIRMNTGYLDIVHLHSCDKWHLETDDAIAALEKAREQGKVRIIAYSGENEALGYAIHSNRFGSIQCSVNLFDQQGIENFLPVAMQKGMGIIAKRPLGNSVWRYSDRPDGHGHAVYFDRMRQMQVNLFGLSWPELALRFAAFTPGVSTVITGSADISHIKDNLSYLEKGPLPAELYNTLRSEFKTKGQSWPGLI